MHKQTKSIYDKISKNATGANYRVRSHYPKKKFRSFKVLFLFLIIGTYLYIEKSNINFLDGIKNISLFRNLDTDNVVVDDDIIKTMEDKIEFEKKLNASK